MRIKAKNLRGSGVPIRFGPLSEPEKFQIDLLEEACLKFSLDLVDIDEVELEIGDRLGEKPYADTGRAIMPQNYLCEGIVWLNFYSPDGRYANISLVPHMDERRHIPTIHPHHNFALYWTDFDGSLGYDDHISGHLIPKTEPVVITIICGKEIRKGTIDVKP